MRVQTPEVVAAKVKEFAAIGADTAETSENGFDGYFEPHFQI